MNQKLTFVDGTTTIHAFGAGQGDYALCGDDLAGDSGANVPGGGYDNAKATKDPVDCRACLNVIAHVKAFYL